MAYLGLTLRVPLCEQKKKICPDYILTDFARIRKSWCVRPKGGPRPALMMLIISVFRAIIAIVE